MTFLILENIGELLMDKRFFKDDNDYVNKMLEMGFYENALEHIHKMIGRNSQESKESSKTTHNKSSVEMPNLLDTLDFLGATEDSPYWRGARDMFFYLHRHFTH